VDFTKIGDCVCQKKKGISQARPNLFANHRALKDVSKYRDDALLWLGRYDATFF
jgi:hypothetical protein